MRSAAGLAQQWQVILADRPQRHLLGHGQIMPRPHTRRLPAGQPIWMLGRQVPCSFRAQSKYWHRADVRVRDVGSVGLRVQRDPGRLCEGDHGMVVVTMFVRVLIIDTVPSLALVT